MDTIDFRSDTVTWPSPNMREAMAMASLGDDVYGEDPTVNELQALSAERVGKDAGLFVASGTMANLVAILTHATRGDEAILGRDTHAYRGEGGGFAVLGGVVPKLLETDRKGRLRIEEVEEAVNPDDPHYPRSRLLVLENSYAAKCGAPIPEPYFAAARDLADRHDLAIHLDGARLFNATVACGVEPALMTKHVDSVSFCLSKGLCAPVGSVLCGSRPFIKEARRARKVLGGGMRQAGVLAAAGIVALNEMVDRLSEDHINAQLLARGLIEVPGIAVDPDLVETNIVFFGLEEDVPLTADEVVAQLQAVAKVQVGTRGKRNFRAVTHYWIGPAEVEKLLSGLHEVLRVKYAPRS